MHLEQKNNRHGGFTDWAIALLLSILLNIALFGIMPTLIRMSPQHQGSQDNFKTVQLITGQHLKLPAEKQDSQNREPENRQKIKFKKFVTVFKQKTVGSSLKRSFDINPKLKLTTAGRTDLAGFATLPALNFTMKGPILKGQYNAKDLDTPLIPIVKIPPMYPARAMRNNIEGWVEVRFLVTDKGQIKNIHIVKAIPEKIFNKSVIRCISRWKFKPGTIDGVPVNTMAETRIKFKLEQ